MFVRFEYFVMKLMIAISHDAKASIIWLIVMRENALWYKHAKINVHNIFPTVYWRGKQRFSAQRYSD